MTLSANILFSLVANETDAVDYAKDVRTTKVEYFKELADGTGADQSQIAWSHSGTIDNEYDFLDLRSLADERGTVVFTAIKAFYIKNTSGSPFSVTGQFVANPWSGPVATLDGAPGSVVIVPGAVAFFIDASAAGWTVDNNNIRNLGFWRAGASATYDIVLIGDGTIT